MVIWSKTAKTQLQKAYNYVIKDSLQNAQIVRDKIIELTIDLPKNPEKYPQDKFKKNVGCNYRAFEVYRYRVSYHIVKDHIRIVRLRHTSMSPLLY